MLKSLKLKLFVLFFLTLSLFISVLGLYLYKSLESFLVSFRDDLLISKLDLIQNFFEAEKGEGGEVIFELTHIMIGEYGRPFSGHYYQVLFPDGKPFVLSPSLKGKPLPLSLNRATKVPQFETINGLAEEQVRVMTVLYEPPVNRPENRTTFVIQIGEHLEDSLVVLHKFKLLLIYSIPFILFLSVVGGMIIAWFSVRSLRTFSEEIGDITEKSLNKRIKLDRFEWEFRGLGNAFNHTLNRLEESFIRHKRFLSDASHELRTPATVIRSYCEIPLRKEREVAEYEKALEVILDNAKRMGGLIEKLLTISRLEQKGFHLNIEKLSLHEMVEKTIGMLKPLSDKKGIAIQFTSVKDSVYVNGDRTYIAEVCMNILENAIKYNHDGGTVTVSVEDGASEVVVKMADSGCGISDEEKTHVFDRFYRVDSSRTKDADSKGEQARGTGLGLSIAKEIVEAHKGRIKVESDGSKGSTFLVYLPKAT